MSLQTAERGVISQGNSPHWQRHAPQLLLLLSLIIASSAGVHLSGNSHLPDDMPADPMQACIGSAGHVILRVVVPSLNGPQAEVVRFQRAVASVLLSAHRTRQNTGTEAQNSNSKLGMCRGVLHNDDVLFQLVPKMADALRERETRLCSCLCTLHATRQLPP